MNNDIQVGDVVECASNDGDYRAVVGKHYKVINKDAGLITVEGDIGQFYYRWKKILQPVIVSTDPGSQQVLITVPGGQQTLTIERAKTLQSALTTVIAQAKDKRVDFQSLKAGEFCSWYEHSNVFMVVEHYLMRTKTVIGADYRLYDNNDDITTSKVFKRTSFTS